MWQWPEPHTGSSGTPILGAKDRDTQSNSPLPGAVTCIRAPFSSFSFSWSGSRRMTVSGSSKTHNRSRALQTSLGLAPNASVIWVGHLQALELIGREIHLQQLAPLSYRQPPAEGVKEDDIQTRRDKFRDHEGRSQSGVAAQVNFPAGVNQRSRYPSPSGRQRQFQRDCFPG